MFLRIGSTNSRFHGCGRHLVGRAKKSDRLGRVILFLKKWWTHRAYTSTFTLGEFAFLEGSGYKRTFLELSGSLLKVRNRDSTWNLRNYP